MNIKCNSKIKIYFVLIYLIFFNGCASKILDSDEAKKIVGNEEFEDLVKVVPMESASPSPGKEILKKEKSSEISLTENGKKLSPPEMTQKKTSENGLKNKKEPLSRRSKKDKVSTAIRGEQKDKAVGSTMDNHKKIKVDLVDSSKTESETSRRPKEDPFRVGEKTVLNLSYFNVSAGDLVLEVLPYVEVNGRKSYHFKISLETSRLFSVVYKVEDWAETHLDFNTLVPYTMAIHVKESKQLKEVRTFFDWQHRKGKYWETKVTEKYGKEKKRLEWELKPYSQNVISAIFYFRTFSLKPNEVIRFEVGDAGKNIDVTATVVKKETLNTTLGKIKTVVLKPSFTIGGVFQPVGDIFFWFTDDERKNLVRIESKIKIGTIVGEVKSIL